MYCDPFIPHFVGGDGGGGFVGFPRAWFRSSSMKCLKKFPALLGSAAVMSEFNYHPLGVYVVSRTCCLSLAQRIARIAAMADVLNGAMDSADTAVEGRASEDLVRTAVRTGRQVEDAARGGGRRRRHTWATIRSWRR